MAKGVKCVCVREVGGWERGPSRELNSLVLTHIDIKFTAMLSFIQVAVNSLFSRFTHIQFRMSPIPKPRDIFTGHPVLAINYFCRFV